MLFAIDKKIEKSYNNVIHFAEKLKKEGKSNGKSRLEVTEIS